MDVGSQLYLELLKKVLTNVIYEDPPTPSEWAPSDEYDRLRLCGGAYLSPDVVRAAAETLGIHIRQIYGSTEFGLALGNMADELQTELGMRPVAGVRARLQHLGDATPDIGELVLRSPCTSEGYVDAAAATARTFRTGEFWTGDVAHRQADGSFRILGRTTEALATAAGPVLAPMLDEQIMQSELVADCATLPVRPGTYRGEVLILVHAMTAGCAAAARGVAGGIARGHGLTARVEVVDAIPRTPVGKPDKPLLRSRYGLTVR